MSGSARTIEELANRSYPYGFVSAVEADSTPPGLDEDIVRLISAKKGEPAFMLDWRLKAYRHDGYWRCMDTRRDLEQIEDDVRRNDGNLPWMR